MTPETKLVYLTKELEALEKKAEYLTKRRLEIMIEMEELQREIEEQQ